MLTGSFIAQKSLVPSVALREDDDVIAASENVEIDEGGSSDASLTFCLLTVQ